MTYKIFFILPFLLNFNFLNGADLVFNLNIPPDSTVKKYFPNGKLRGEEIITNKGKHGYIKKYSPDGNLFSHGNYIFHKNTTSSQVRLEISFYTKDDFLLYGYDGSLPSKDSTVKLPVGNWIYYTDGRVDKVIKYKYDIMDIKLLKIIHPRWFYNQLGSLGKPIKRRTEHPMFWSKEDE